MVLYLVPVVSSYTDGLGFMRTLLVSSQQNQSIGYIMLVALKPLIFIFRWGSGFLIQCIFKEKSWSLWFIIISNTISSCFCSTKETLHNLHCSKNCVLNASAYKMKLSAWLNIMKHRSVFFPSSFRIYIKLHETDVTVPCNRGFFVNG